MSFDWLMIHVQTSAVKKRATHTRIRSIGVLSSPLRQPLLPIPPSIIILVIPMFCVILPIFDGLVEWCLILMMMLVLLERIEQHVNNMYCSVAGNNIRERSMDALSDHGRRVQLGEARRLDFELSDDNIKRIIGEQRGQREGCVVLDIGPA